jgi:hypothetical protein
MEFSSRSGEMDAGSMEPVLVFAVRQNGALRAGIHFFDAFASIYNRCILFEGPISCDRYKNLDVSYLWLDL